jgi:hypothetical protein
MRVNLEADGLRLIPESRSERSAVEWLRGKWVEAKVENGELVLQVRGWTNGVEQERVDAAGA